MTKKGVIFADIDGTFRFHEEVHGIKLIEVLDNRKCLVVDKYSKLERVVYDTSTSLYKAYVDLKTVELFKKLSEKYYIFINSGARKKSTDSIYNIMGDVIDGYILESGCIVLDKYRNFDEEWKNYIDNNREGVDKFKKQLKIQKWVLDEKEKLYAVRVRLTDNPNREKEFRYLKDLDDPDKKEKAQKVLNLVYPEGVKFTRNIGNAEFIPSVAGKDIGTNHILKKYDLIGKPAFAIVDDQNDLPIPKEVTPYVLGNAYQDMLDEANKKENKWYISKAKYFDGINEILQKILEK